MDKVIIIILIFLAAKVFGKSGKKKNAEKAGGPVRKQRPAAEPVTVQNANKDGDMIERVPREPKCGLPHESIPDEVHEGLDPCHDGQEAVPVKTVEAIPEPRPLQGLTLSDAARGIVMAEVLGRPGGRWANRRQ